MSAKRIPDIRRDDEIGDLHRVLQLEGLREHGSGRILRVHRLVAAGVLASSHIALAGHMLAAGHLPLAHLAHVGSAGDCRQQRPRK